MKWIARVFVFAVAFCLSTIATSIFVIHQSTDLTGSSVVVRRHTGTVRVDAETIPGTWNGSWGRNAGACPIDIDRVEGEVFYGKLRKEGAEILIEGTFNPTTREVFFEETKVIRLGTHMSKWSLGSNRGTFSQNGRVMFGTGVDEWGQYTWTVSK